MNYIIDHIPRSTPYNRRPAFPMEPDTITIHNTGNPKSTARNERAWLTNSTNYRQASYHIAVDEHEAIECLPLNENGWHAGDGKSGKGNRKSLGVEICESGNYAKTLENAVQLVAKMLLERGWGVDRLRRHFDWSKKICPRLMYDGGSWAGWNEFKRRVDENMAKFKDVPEKHWAYTAIDKVSGAGIMKGYPDGTFGLGKTVTREELAAVIAKLLEKKI